MRLDPLLDAFYILGSVWGSLAGSQVCTSAPPGLSSASLRTSGRGASAVVTAFVDVNVVPMDTERVLTNHTVVVAGDRITALGPASQVKVPAGAVRVDGKGKFLIPGLTDMHHHMWGDVASGKPSVPTERVTQDSLFLALAGGVTALRFLDDHRTFTRERLLQAWRARPEVPTPYVYFSPNILFSTKPDSVAAVVAAAKAAGYDFLQMPVTATTYTSLATETIASGNLYLSPRERVVFDSILAAARRVGLPVAVHDAPPLRFEEMLALGAASGSYEHVNSGIKDSLYPSIAGRTMSAWDNPSPPSIERIRQAVTLVQRAGVWVTPTLVCKIGRGGSITGEAPADDLYNQLTKALQDAGGKLLLSGDDGWTVHDELGAMVRAGLTPYQALRTGTYNIAQYFGQLNERGTVAVGKRADLVLLYDNPLQDIRHTREPAGVMVAGQWLDRADLDRRLLAWKSSGLHASENPPAKPHPWLLVALNSRGIFKRGGNDSQLSKSLLKLAVLVDSLGTVPPSEKLAYERAMRSLAAELGTLRVALKPAQHARFDPIARVWLREQLRQGYQVAIPGVTAAP